MFHCCLAYAEMSGYWTGTARARVTKERTAKKSIVAGIDGREAVNLVVYREMASTEVVRRVGA